MRFAVVLSTHQTSFDALAFKGDLAGNLNRIASYGYDGVELAVRDASTVDAGALRTLTSSVGLEVAALGTGQAWNDDRLSLSDESASVRRAAIDRLYGHIDLAAELRAPVIIGLVRGVVYGDPEGLVANRLLEGLRQIGLRAEDRRVRLAIEAINRYETSLVNTVAEGLSLIEQLEIDSVGLLLDTFHMNIEEPHIEESIRHCGKRIVHFHVADSNRWYPGAGHIDFPSILRALVETGFDDYVSGEFLPFPDPEQAARRGLDALKKWEDEITSSPERRPS